MTSEKVAQRLFASARKFAIATGYEFSSKCKNIANVCYQTIAKFDWLCFAHIYM